MLRWATGQSQWHSDQPHKYLVKYLDILTKVNIQTSSLLKEEYSHPDQVMYLIHSCNFSPSRMVRVKLA